GLVVGRGRGRDEADALPIYGERRQRRGRLELDRSRELRPCPLAARQLAAARHADRVLEEDAVELRRLGDLRDVGIALEVHVVGRDGVGMPPPGEMVARDREEAAETEHALVHGHALPDRGPPGPLMIMMRAWRPAVR